MGFVCLQISCMPESLAPHMRATHVDWCVPKVEGPLRIRYNKLI
jgi:hypothetical protein